MRMPIYEFACADCRKKVSVFQRSITATVEPHCPECGGAHLRRLVSAFAFHRAGGDFDDFSDLDGEFPEGVDENDPAAVARWARRMSERMGGDLPPGFEDDLAQMEAGGMPSDMSDDGFDDWDD